MTSRRAVAVALVLLLQGCRATPSREPAGTSELRGASVITDPLPSWRNGSTKAAIVEFVARVTTPGSADFVAEADRVAAFDNDGTLWQEKPLAQLAFTAERLEALAAKDPTLRSKQPFKAALERDAHYFQAEGEKAVMPLLVATHGGMTEESFDADARVFFSRARHPKLGLAYTELTYRPMIELLAYLRSKGFVTYVCSGGDADFMRTVTESLYGVGPERVIGTTMKRKSRAEAGTIVLYREAELDSFNDKLEKPVNLQVHVGKRPLFAAGNVGNGGDVAMLEFSKGRRGASFQMLVRHDDAEREFAYGDDDATSLDAARDNEFVVVSMKNDWSEVFTTKPRP